MHFDDLFTSLDIRQSDDDLSVKSARSEQRRVQNVRTVGRRQNDDAGILREAVHFNQQLIERLFSFIMTAADARTALAADRIDLIDKDNTRRILFGLVEQVSDSGRTDTDEHFHEIGTADRKERYARFACRRLGNIGLTGSRRTDQQNTFRDSSAKLLVFFRCLEEVHDLLKLLLFFLQSRYVFKGHLLVAALNHLGARFAELERLAVAALIHHNVEQEDQRTDHQQVRQQIPKERAGIRLWTGEFFQRTLLHLIE